MLYYVIGYAVVILKVAVGLGFVIFVHEVGHFAVAKLCGVKCEKFYLGFDIAGLKLLKFRWGETEYGVGILPLGGYVKMLGQEDNPARLREEMERAKLNAESGQPPSEAEQALFDPRSFLAQSVPKRMAIISAGVIMNVIFAFVLAVVAFSMGVEQLPCVIGDVFPGEAAWQADLRSDDKVLEIAGKPMSQFRDLQTAISLGNIDPEKGVPMLIERPGVKERLTVTVKPDASRGVFVIGVTNGRTTELILERKTWLVQNRPFASPGSAAAVAKPPFRNGDKIVRIDDVPVEDYAQINQQLARKPDKKIAVTVHRTLVDEVGKPTGPAQKITIAVDPNPMRQLGAVMKMGEITAVQAGSPAAKAGILRGDVILQIDGKAVTDPMTLPDRLRRPGGETIELTLQREKSKTPVVVQVPLREPRSFFSPDPDRVPLDQPAEVPELGVVYRVLNRVDHVLDGSPAAKAGLAPDDLIVRARLLPPDKETMNKWQMDQSEATINFTEKERNWASLTSVLQGLLPGTKVELTFLRQDKEQTVTLEPAAATNWFNPDRGFLLEPMSFSRKAAHVGEAIALGGRETLDALTIVFRTVGKISTNQVSPRNLGGPWMIIKMALRYADQGNAMLLIFLTMLSANLAVLNFLPIPLLDGGHMVLLIYEGLRGKPANERVQVALTYIGLVFILGLMVWVFGLDLGLISRR